MAVKRLWFPPAEDGTSLLKFWSCILLWDIEHSKLWLILLPGKNVQLWSLNISLNTFPLINANSTKAKYFLKLYLHCQQFLWKLSNYLFQKICLFFSLFALIMSQLLSYLEEHKIRVLWLLDHFTVNNNAIKNKFFKRKFTFMICHSV